jgi:hypothetical protein
MLPLSLPAAGVDEFLDRLSDDGVTVVIEPVDHRTDRRKFLILDNCRVIECAYQGGPTLEFLEQAFVVDVEAERFRGCIEICAVDKDSDLTLNLGHSYPLEPPVVVSIETLPRPA